MKLEASCRFAVEGSAIQGIEGTLLGVCLSLFERTRLQGSVKWCRMNLLLASLLLILPLIAHAEYLGELSANELNPNSIFNDVGLYGNLAPTSHRNSIGVYGSPISLYSATNPLAWHGDLWITPYPCVASAVAPPRPGSWRPYDSVRDAHSAASS